MSIFQNRDCLKAMKEMCDNSIDLAIVDPPYGIKRFKKGSGHTRFKCSTMMQENGLSWDNKPPKEYFIELFRVSKFQIIWGANNFTLPESEYFLVWDKIQTVSNFASAEYAWTNIKQPAKVFRYSIHLHNHTNKIHPTQKPLPLYKWILKNYAKQGNIILDTHVGSGSSLIACEQMGFDYIGYELDADYYNAAKKRLKEETLQIDMFQEPKQVIAEQVNLF